MSFIDSVKSTAQRGKDTVERKGRGAQLKMQQNDLIKKRKDLMAQLGASIYPEIRDDSAYTVGREALFGAIEDLDMQMSTVEKEIASLEEAAAAAQSPAYVCHSCGNTVHATDMFCAGCGTPVAVIVEAAQQQMSQVVPNAGASRFCSNCGHPLEPGDQFCMGCGTRTDAGSVPAALPALDPPTDADPAAGIYDANPQT